MVKTRATKRKATSRKRKAPSRMQVYGAAGKQLWHDVKRLKQLINVETKVAPVTNIASPTSIGATTGTQVSVLLNPIAQGDGYASRTGLSVRSQRLYGNYRLLPGASATIPQEVRVVILRDKRQIDSTAPVWSDVFASDHPLTMFDPTEIDRWQILHDELVELSVASPRMSKGFRPVHQIGFHCKYSTSASGSINENGLYLMALSTDGTNPPSIEYSFFYEYTDN